MKNFLLTKLHLMWLPALLIPFSLSAQTAGTFFKLLPASCTPEISKKERNLLLKHGEYIIPGGDSDETVKYTVEEVSNNYLQYEYSFTTGQRAFNEYELKVFKQKNGQAMILYSNYGGLPAAYF